MLASLQFHTGTGFPIALPRPGRSARPQAGEVRQQLLRQWASRQARQRVVDAQRAKEAAARRVVHRKQHEGDKTPLLQPVYRASPYAAELLREQKATTASILFLDEGNLCRSMLCIMMWDVMTSRCTAVSSAIGQGSAKVWLASLQRKPWS